VDLLQVAEGFEGKSIMLVHYLIRVEVVILGTILVALLLRMFQR
jgi:hypothetical protein